VARGAGSLLLDRLSMALGKTSKLDSTIYPALQATTAVVEP
jgi:hypothetical protein